MSTPVVIHPLASKLLEELERRHLTQRETAEQLGVSERTLVYWFRQGGTPRARHRRAIVAWLDSGNGAEAA